MSPRELWDAEKGYAVALARRYYKGASNVPLEDLEQAALLALWEAALRYDDSSPADFRTFAWHRIRGALTRERWGLHFLGVNAHKAVSDGRMESLPDSIPLPERAREEYNTWLGRKDMTIPMWETLDSITDEILEARRRRVAKMVYLEGATTREIAEKLDIPQLCAYQLRDHARANVLRLLERRVI